MLLTQSPNSLRFESCVVRSLAQRFRGPKVRWPEVGSTRASIRMVFHFLAIGQSLEEITVQFTVELSSRPTNLESPLLTESLLYKIFFGVYRRRVCSAAFLPSPSPCHMPRHF